MKTLINFLIDVHSCHGKEQGLCKEALTNSSKWDAKVCNMINAKEEYKKLTKLCESDYGGTILPVNIVYDSQHFHRSFVNYPYCKPPSCSADDINTWYEYLIRAHTRKNSDHDSTVIKHNAPNACDEPENEKAWVRLKNLNPVMKTCRWLQKRPKSKLRGYCRKKNEYKGRQSAYNTCKRTCCSCMEDSNDTFLKKIKTDKKGRLKFATQTCGWLQNADDKTRQKICTEDVPELGGYLAAKKICPNTCEVCSNSSK